MTTEYPPNKGSLERLYEQAYGDRCQDDQANAEAQAAIEWFLNTFTKAEPRTAREKAARRGLRVIEGGKTK